MKKIIFAIIIALTTITNVKALENISIEEKEYLNQIGYEDIEIYHMTTEEYNEIKETNPILVGENTKYYKTIYLNNNNTMYRTNNINTLTKEITKEEYENENNISLTADDTVTTEYKKMKLTLTYTSSSNQYTAKNTLTWRKMPKVRSKDIIAMANNSAVSEPVAGTYSAYTIHENWDSCKETGTSTKTNHTSPWKKTASGAGISFNLPKNTTKSYTWNDLTGDVFDCVDTNLKTGGTGTVNANITVTSIVTTLKYNLSKVSNASLSIYGSYRHGTKTIDLNPGFSIDKEKNPAISINPEIKNSYDQMSNTQVTITNPSW